MKINKSVCDSCWKHGIDSPVHKTFKFYNPYKPVTRGAPQAEETLDLCLGCYNDVIWLLDRKPTERLRPAE